jgi:enoyl-CoA hydratase/carnithine racemase
MTLVLREDHEGVATLRFNRPDKLNALTIGLFRELRGHVEALQTDDSVACVVVRGAGACFRQGMTSPISRRAKRYRPLGGIAKHFA